MSIQRTLLNQIATDYHSTYHSTLIIHLSKELSGGCVNNALQLDTNIGSLFLKWNIKGDRDLFVQEANSLDELNKYANEFIQFPKPILSKQINEKPGYLLTTFITLGSHLNSEENLGRGVASMHLNSATNFGFHNSNYCGSTLQNNSLKDNWIEFYRDNRLTFIIGLIQKKFGWNKTEEDLINKFIDKLPNLLPENTKPSLVHGDLWSGNYMFTNSKPALIDPCISYSDREFEFGIALLFGGFSERFFKAYNEIYPLAPDWKSRNKLYQLYHLLNHYFMFGGGYKLESLRIMQSYL